MKTKPLDPIAEVRKAREELLAEHAHDLRSLVAALNARSREVANTTPGRVIKAKRNEKFWGRASAAHRKASLASL